MRKMGPTALPDGHHNMIATHQKVFPTPMFPDIREKWNYDITTLCIVVVTILVFNFLYLSALGVFNLKSALSS